MNDKSLISGGNAEDLPAGNPASQGDATDKTAADTLYPDADKTDAVADKKDEKSTAEPVDKTDEKATDGKSDADKDATDKKDGENKKDDTKQDEEYTAPDLSDLEMPEGFKANEEIMKDLSSFVTDRKLSKEDAAALIPIGAKIAANLQAAQTEAYAEVRAGWREEVINDKVLGTREQMAIADKGLTAYGTPELRKLLDETGLGDHPEIIRAFHKIGKTVSEDVIERGGSGDSVNTKAEDAMYPTMKK